MRRRFVACRRRRMRRGRAAGVDAGGDLAAPAGLRLAVPAQRLQFTVSMGGMSLVKADVWAAEWWLLQDWVAPLFRRADLRRQARDRVRGLLGPAARKNCWQLEEFAGRRSPGSMQLMLAAAVGTPVRCGT